MPPVIAYIASVLVTYVGVSAAVATWISTLLVNGVIMFAAQKLLSRNPNLGGDFMNEVANRTQMVRQSIASRKLVYGRCKISGPMIYASEGGPNREYLYLVVVLCSHEVEAITDIFINDELVILNGNQPFPGTKYAGKLLVNTHLGTDDQLADPMLVNDCPDWTDDHRLQGHAYLAIKLTYDETVYTGVPNISAIVKGMKITDPRDGITRYTTNAALCIMHYMQSRYGLVAPVDEFHSDTLLSSINICDEDVTIATAFTRHCMFTIGRRAIEMVGALASEMDGVKPGMSVTGTGIPDGAIILTIVVNPDTQRSFFTIDRAVTSTEADTVVSFGTTEKRYTCNGSIDTSVRPGDNIEAMLSSMAGKVIWAGGKWFVHAGHYQTPTITLDENDLRGAIQVTTKLDRRELANGSKGTYVSEGDGWVATDIPPYKPALYYEEDDEERLWRDVQLPFTLSVSTAQRLIKIELERIRQQITVRMPCKLSALKVQCGDNIMLNNTRHGWTNKVFEVTSFILVPYKDGQDKPMLGVDIVLRETAAACWDWNDGEETTVDPAPNTNLPNPFIAYPPTNLQLLSDGTTSWRNADGVYLPRLLVTWDAPTDQYVLSGGRFRIQYRLYGEANWKDWSLPPGDQLQDYINDVRTGNSVEVRIRSETGRGFPSDWVYSAATYPVGYLIPSDVIAPDVVTGLAAAGLPEAIRLVWTLPDLTVYPNQDMDRIEIYESGSALPAPVAGSNPTYRLGKVSVWTRDQLVAGVTGYYWVRTVDATGNKSAWVGPVNATAQSGSTDALTAAAAAQATANSRNRIFRQSTAPTNPTGGYGLVVGDYWIDTTFGNENRTSVWTGSAWEPRFVPILRLDANNNITGLVKADGTDKDWVLVANKFQIWNGTSADVPFEIIGGIVYIKQAFVRALDAVAGTIAGYDVSNNTLGSVVNGFLLQTNRMTMGVASVNGLDFNWASGDGTVQGWHNSKRSFALSTSGSSGFGRLQLYDDNGNVKISLDPNSNSQFSVSRDSSFNASIIGGFNAGSAQADYLLSVIHRQNAPQKYGMFVGTNWAANENKIIAAGSVDAVTGAVTDRFNIRGDGYMQYGVHNALAGETVTGYIYIMDMTGTYRKLAVVS